ncbi:sulfurtransferase TusA [Candidatus Schneideria nysicola]|uniref:sulfurtransferase TusA n=1 Tax=Candidatus Schneideria nysicola TaxID=1081631 RepID=UPI001CAA479B|nr:sulfurtransferase TusA [Candidatus Schneideria nysicola]UAJ65591.1 sulfurtransferase TusA [Candidatus Schneideria nysicola]
MNTRNIHNKILDLRGLRCPEPIMIIRQSIEYMQLGQILHIISDDISTIKDIPFFCHFMNHTLLKRTKVSPYHFFLRKGIKEFNTQK